MDGFKSSGRHLRGIGGLAQVFELGPKHTRRHRPAVSGLRARRARRTPNPGAFGTLEQWQAWRQELLALGPETAGVDVELQIADKVIARMHGGPE